MSFTQAEEQKLTTLFKEQEVLDKRSSKYLANRNEIAALIENRLKSKMTACWKTWQYKYHLDESDCESLMYECLLTSIDNYRISRGNCKFTSFFWTITGQLFKNYLGYLYAQKRSPSKVIAGDSTPSFSDSSDVLSSSEMVSVFDNISDKRTSVEDLYHAKLLVEKIYKGATNKQKQILKRLYVGKRYQEISTALKICPSTITNILKKLKEGYESLEKEV
jgi:DNA-directed RNA polymerase specialized sigma24 family protein